MYLFPLARAYMYLFPLARAYMYLFPLARAYMYLFPLARAYIYLIPLARAYIYHFPLARAYIYLFPLARGLHIPLPTSQGLTTTSSHYQGAYLWVPGLAEGVDDSSLDRPPARCTDGGLHVVVATQTIELPIFLPAIGSQRLPTKCQ